MNVAKKYIVYQRKGHFKNKTRTTFAGLGGCVPSIFIGVHVVFVPPSAYTVHAVFLIAALN